MSDRTYTRRRALRLGSAGLLAGIAGCSDITGGNGNGGNGGDGNGDGEDGNGNGGTGSGNGNGGNGDGSDEMSATSPSLGAVPSGSAMIGYVEVGTLLEGPVVRQGVEETIALLNEQGVEYGGPGSYEELLSMAESEIGLDPNGLRSVTMFGGFGDSGAEEAGVVMNAEWSESDVVGALESEGGASLSKQTYNGATLYTGESGSGALAVLPDGRHVFGVRTVVESVVDVVAGDADPVSGRVVTAFENAPDGPIKFGADLTRLPDSGGTGPMGSVETVSAGMGAQGGQRRMVVEMETADEESATQLGSLVEFGISEMQSQSQGASEMPQQYRDAIAELEDIQVQTDGTTVTVSYSANAEETGVFGTMIAAVVATFAIGLGTERQAQIPQAAFAFDYDGGAGTVTITHEGGDTIDGSNLYVRGETGSGRVEAQWAAEYGVSEVSAGSSVTVEGVQADFTLRVVWVSSDGETSATLGEFRGPEA